MRLTHLDEHQGRFWLRWTPDAGEPFEVALDGFKSAVPLALRDWDEGQRLWHLPATPETEALLARLFPDFAPRLVRMRSQLSLL